MFPYDIHPIIPEKDAADSAVLIETCFRPWLDQDNLNYLRSLREEGTYAMQHPLLTRFSVFPYKLEGVVCRDHDGKLLGLINSYFFQLNGKDCCLLANVCVDPAHRGEGIASQMLEKIEEIQFSAGIRDLFLQARVQMPEVIQLYRRRNFMITDYRDTWICPAGKPLQQKDPGLRLEPVPGSDREKFRSRMAEVYPDTVLWNLDCKKGLFHTGTAALVRNWIETPSNRFRRVVNSEGQVRAWAAYQKMNGSADTLWFIPEEDLSADSRISVLQFLRSCFPGKKPLKLDTATGSDPRICKEAGFSHLQTLAWMWKKL